MREEIALAGIVACLGLLLYAHVPDWGPDARAAYARLLRRIFHRSLTF